MFLTNFSVESNPPLNTMRHVVFKVITLHESTDVLLSGDPSNISLENNDPAERITLVLVGIPVIHQLV